jgi:hypothetical protein
MDVRPRPGRSACAFLLVALLLAPALARAAKSDTVEKVTALNK